MESVRVQIGNFVEPQEQLLNSRILVGSRGLIVLASEYSLPERITWEWTEEKMQIS